jgi:hypothetical protein
VTTLSIGVRAETSPALTVRLYNTSGIAAPELAAATRTAESILRDTGIDVTFRQCGRQVSPADAVDACDDRLMPSEVVVRMINAPAFHTTLSPDAYGVAYVVQETNRGWLATVFGDRSDQAAARVGVEPGSLLGRVMAHEVGHLLLGAGYHGDAGLMRAHWPDALLGHAGEEWRFSVLEAARLHDVLTNSNPRLPVPDNHVARSRDPNGPRFAPNHQ